MSKNNFMLKNVKCIYPTLAEPKGYKEGDDKKYSITLLIPKSDKEMIVNFTKWIKACVDGTTWKKADKDHIKKTAVDFDNGFNKYCILKDGDVINAKRVEDEEGEKGFYKGVIVVKASKNEAHGKPTVVNPLNKVLTAVEIAGAITSGDIVNVQVYGSCYDFQGSKGFALKLNAVQLVKEGEDLTSHNPFDALEVEESEVAEETTEEGNPFK